MERYNRQIILDGIGIAGQNKIKNASVLIVGIGGLGSIISLYLTAAGVGKIGLIDDDTVSISNLQRQILYCESDLNLQKVDCAKKRLQKLNSEVEFITYSEKLNSENAEKIISEYDIIVDGCDNFETRYLIDDVCSKYKKPYVFGAISEFSGQVSIFNYKDSAKYQDLFPKKTVNENTTKLSNGVLGVLPGIIGTVEANEVIKIITEIGEILTNKLFSINILTMESTVFEIK